MPVNAEAFNNELRRIFTEATSRGFNVIEVNAGDLHRAVGDYARGTHRTPTCCNVMRQNLSVRDRILSEPPKGIGPSLTIRYALPR